MAPWRDLGKLVIVAVVFGASFAMLVDAIGPRSPWLGLLLMFYFLGLVKVADPLFKLRMPQALRTVKHGLGADHIYRLLGVRGFGTLLRDTPLRHLNDSVYLASGEHSLATLAIQAGSAEARTSGRRSCSRPTSCLSGLVVSSSNRSFSWWCKWPSTSTRSCIFACFARDSTASIASSARDAAQGRSVMAMADHFVFGKPLKPVVGSA